MLIGGRDKIYVDSDDTFGTFLLSMNLTANHTAEKNATTASVLPLFSASALRGRSYASEFKSRAQSGGNETNFRIFCRRHWPQYSLFKSATKGDSMIHLSSTCWTSGGQTSAMLPTVTCCLLLSHAWFVLHSHRAHYTLTPCQLWIGFDISKPKNSGLWQSSNYVLSQYRPRPTFNKLRVTDVTKVLWILDDLQFDHLKGTSSVTTQLF